jgi:hypothetical protein
MHTLIIWHTPQGLEMYSTEDPQIVTIAKQAHLHYLNEPADDDGGQLAVLALSEVLTGPSISRVHFRSNVPVEGRWVRLVVCGIAAPVDLPSTF